MSEKLLPELPDATPAHRIHAGTLVYDGLQMRAYAIAAIEQNTRAGGEAVGRVIFTNRKKPDVEWLVDRLERDTLLYTKPAAGSGEDGGWIVGDSSGNRWRTWENAGPVWTEDREKATRYARREDAEAVHGEDEDAWHFVPYAAPVPAGSEVVR
jgi:hypothetical protein